MPSLNAHMIVKIRLKMRKFHEPLLIDLEELMTDSEIRKLYFLIRRIHKNTK